MNVLNAIEWNTELIYLVAAVCVVVVQIVLCCTVENGWIRSIPTVLAFVVTLLFVVLTFTADGLIVLGYLALAIYSGITFLAALVISVVGWLIRKCRK